MNTLYWHDYETTGTDPRYDRPLQFAGVRTDEDLNIIGEPLMLYAKPATDVLMHPQAALVTGLTPAKARDNGVCEAEFIQRIHAELAEPGTCGVGYNSLRFDDEFTRFTLFRNFFDAYAREWQNGNSRWDIIDMVRMTRALRPEGIEWPDREDGQPSFRLEHLTAANGIEHAGAHDALADVYATIELAKLIRHHQPKLYDYVYQNRGKQQIGPLLNLQQKPAVIHTSRMYPASRCHTAMVMPLARDPLNKNAIIVADLRDDPSDLLSLDADTLREHLFTAGDALPDGVKRPPLKAVHINKCPVIVPINTLTDEAAERLEIDRDKQLQHREQLLAAGEALSAKIAEIFQPPAFPPVTDVDATLYSGGFFGDSDKRKMQLIREAGPDQLSQLHIPFDDDRLSEMLFRYRARNWPESLKETEQQQWRDHCVQVLSTPDSKDKRSFSDFFAALQTAREQTLSTDDERLLDALEQDVIQQQQSLGIT